MDGKRMPNAHPKPYESALWQHLDTIRLLRRQRKTWAAIATHLEQAHGFKTSIRAVHKFFKRASGARIPLGFSDTGLTTNKAGSAKPSTKPGVDAHDDPFSVETIPEELFAKTKRKYARENKA
jgi:hypothetical protein